METKKSIRANLENKRTLFLIIGFLVAFIVVFAALNFKKEVPAVKTFDNMANANVDEDYTPPNLKPDKPYLAPPPKPIIVETILIADDVSNFDDPDIASTEIRFGDAIIPEPLRIGDEKPAVVDSTFRVVEEMPVFPGGEKALLSWLSRNIKYPSIAIQNDVQGTVYVQFIVDKNGSISDATIVRSVDEALDNEALRVVKDLPKWMPGKQRGIPVRVIFTLPINFKLQRS